MEDDLMQLQMLFSKQIKQVGDNQIEYSTDQFVIVFEYPEDYPDSPFTYKSSIEFNTELVNKLKKYQDSTLDFITCLSQNFKLSSDTIKNVEGQDNNQFKRFVYDTHNHVFRQYYDDEKTYVQQIENMKETNGATFIAVSSDPSKYEENYQDAIKYDYRLSVGIHPFVVARLYEEDQNLYYQKIEELVNIFQQFIKTHQNEVGFGKRIVSIGECGLSSDDPQLMRLQTKVVKQQADIALKHDIPLIIHAHRKQQLQEIVDFIAQNPVQYKKLKMNIHGFSADVKQLEKLDSLIGQLRFSCNLILLKQSSNFKKAVNRLGIDKVLVETDSPGLRVKEDEVSGPAAVVKVLQHLSTVLDMNIDALAMQVNCNAQLFFGL